MKILRGNHAKTIGFGIPYPKSVTDRIRLIWRYPWIDPTRGWKTPHSVSYQVAPRPRGSLGEVIFPVPSLVSRVYTRASDGTLAIDCKVNIVGHPLQGKTYTIWHCGKIFAEAGQWVDGGALVGFVGGKYGFTGAGTAPHIALTLKTGRKYIDPQPLIDWQPPKTPPVEPKKEIFLPVEAPTMLPVEVSEPELKVNTAEDKSCKIKREVVSENMVQTMPSKKYTLNKADLTSIGKGLAIAVAGAGLTYITEISANIDFGEFTPLAVVLLSVFVNLGRKFLAGGRK